MIVKLNDEESKEQEGILYTHSDKVLDASQARGSRRPIKDRQEFNCKGWEILIGDATHKSKTKHIYSW